MWEYSAVDVNIIPDILPHPEYFNLKHPNIAWVVFNIQYIRLLQILTHGLIVGNMRGSNSVKNNIAGV